MNIDTENKKLIMDFHRRVTEGDLEGAGALVAEDLVNHAAIPEAQGRAGLRAILSKLLKAFPDVKYEVEDIVAEGDRVVCRATMTGTHTAALEFARLPLPPTGRSVRITQIHIFRIAGGLVVEHWGCRDDLAMLRQLGVSAMAAA